MQKKSKPLTLLLSLIAKPAELAALLGSRLLNHPKPLLIAAQAEYALSLALPAKRLYKRLLDGASAPGAAHPYWRWQQLQFAHERCRHALGESAAHDPLHFVCVEKSRASAPRPAEKTAGKYSIKVTYRGLEVRGRLTAPAGGPPTDTVELTVDGRAIRRHAVRYAKGRARFSFSIRRPVLSLFPRNCVFAARTASGAFLSYRGAGAAELSIPHGDGRLLDIVTERGALNKKGVVRPSPAELAARQEALLELYVRANAAFESCAGRPLLLMFGTLLGYRRSGDFIPGDDDFDVGYVSAATNAAEAKAESLVIMQALVGAGFTVVLNRQGKPFRLLDTEGDSDLHLDVCPIWSEAGKLYAPPFGYLDMPIEALQPAESAYFRRTAVRIPANTDLFLEKYYGPNWRIPDPSYSFSFDSLPPEARRTLKAIRLSPREVVALRSGMDDLRKKIPGAGIFSSRIIFDLYPLDAYSRYCGW